MLLAPVLVVPVLRVSRFWVASLPSCRCGGALAELHGVPVGVPFGSVGSS